MRCFLSGRATHNGNPRLAFFGPTGHSKCLPFYQYCLGCLHHIGDKLVDGVHFSTEVQKEFTLSGDRHVKYSMDTSVNELLWVKACLITQEEITAFRTKNLEKKARFLVKKTDEEKIEWKRKMTIARHDYVKRNQFLVKRKQTKWVEANVAKIAQKHAAHYVDLKKNHPIQFAARAAARKVKWISKHGE
jgi:hypothetical protein